jgi:wyosine [tRNA(Phe)-imidazoG37] synthetase (radical SAM superfamily)
MIRASRGGTRRPQRGATPAPASRVGATMAETRQPPPTPSLPIAFGPVRSRRLGWSLGINNVPPKTCTYSCVYCQVGATDRARLDREAFIAPDVIVDAVAARLAECRAASQPVDYATFVPDGEPTLDWNLGVEIRFMSAPDCRVAVLTNGSLLWRDDVRDELAGADLVSVKVDTVDEPTWRRLNRPIGCLRLEPVLEGMRRFAAEYRGDLVTETMLVAGINDDEASTEQTARFIAALEPLRAYVAIPTRPPAEPWVRAPSIEAARRAADIFRAAEVPAELLFEDDHADTFSPSSDPAAGLLGIVAVHPMSIADARIYLSRSGGDWSVVQRLLDEGRLVTVTRDGRTYLRTRT